MNTLLLNNSIDFIFFKKCNIEWGIVKERSPAHVCVKLFASYCSRRCSFKMNLLIRNGMLIETSFMKFIRQWILCFVRKMTTSLFFIIVPLLYQKNCNSVWLDYFIVFICSFGKGLFGDAKILTRNSVPVKCAVQRWRITPGSLNVLCRITNATRIHH